MKVIIIQRGSDEERLPTPFQKEFVEAYKKEFPDDKDKNLTSKRVTPNRVTIYDGTWPVGIILLDEQEVKAMGWIPDQ